MFANLKCAFEKNERYQGNAYKLTSSQILCHFHVMGVQGEVYSIQHYMIKLVSDLRHVGGFLRVLRFIPPIKLTATI